VALARLGIEAPELEPIVAREREELERRGRAYRGARPAIGVEGRTVVLVDDGVATGGTARAGAWILRALGARRIVLATPVGAPDIAGRIARDVDDVVQLEAPERFCAVGQAYERFDQTSDEEVNALLDAARLGSTPPVFADPPDDRVVGGVGHTRMHHPYEMVVVRDAGHLFEESGALEQVAALSADWFHRYLMTSPGEARAEASAS
jgi:putative phosphoribosyl transferase